MSGRSSFGGSFEVISDANWTIYPPGTCYLVMVRLIPEEVGFSVYAPKLPGAVSQGETVAEAIANITEALAGCLQTYKAHGQEIPWAAEIPPLPAGELERWVVVDIRTEEEKCHDPV